MQCKSSQLVLKELSPVVVCSVFNGYGLMPTVAVCAVRLSSAQVLALHCGSTPCPISFLFEPLYLLHQNSSPFFGWGIEPTPLSDPSNVVVFFFFNLRACLFFPSIPASLGSILVSPSAVGTCCSRALFLVSSCSCSLL